jgi:beta-fructofuranosidase
MNSLKDAMKSIENARIVAEKCPYRPKFHFIPPANWINDPNGPIFYKDEYHLFYQHNPYHEYWGSIHWGHAKSKDLVYWEHLPIALAPSKEFGEEHCFSGCCVVNKGIPSVIYTSIGPERLPSNGAEQWLATSNDNMLSWQKYPENPIMTLKLHKELDIREWRDPYVWKENNKWYMVLGGNIHKSRAGSALLYESLDLIHWKFLNPLCKGEKGNKITGSNWECPNFFPLGNSHVLIVSPHRRVVYTIGEYKNFKFLPGEWKILDHGRVFYAPNTMFDIQGRLIMWGWIQQGGTGGWNGCLTIPRILSLDLDGNLNITPAPELQKLRDLNYHIEYIIINPNSKDILEKINGKCLEIRAVFEIIDAKSFGFKIFQSKNNDGESIGYDIQNKILWAGSEKGEIEIKNNVKKVKFHIFIDKSVVEVFFNDRECITARIYPKSEDADKINLFAQDGKVKVVSLDVWNLRSLW